MYFHRSPNPIMHKGQIKANNKEMKLVTFFIEVSLHFIQTICLLQVGHRKLTKTSSIIITFDQIGYFLLGRRTSTIYMWPLRDVVSHENISKLIMI